MKNKKSAKKAPTPAPPLIDPAAYEPSTDFYPYFEPDTI